MLSSKSLIDTREAQICLIQKNLQFAKLEETKLKGLELLSRLQMTVPLLKKTGIGKTINAMSATEDKVGGAALDLLIDWKNLVINHYLSGCEPLPDDSNSSDEESSVDELERITSAAQETTGVKRKFSESSLEDSDYYSKDTANFVPKGVTHKKFKGMSDIEEERGNFSSEDTDSSLSVASTCIWRGNSRERLSGISDILEKTGKFSTDDSNDTLEESAKFNLKEEPNEKLKDIENMAKYNLKEEPNEKLKDVRYLEEKSRVFSPNNFGHSSEDSAKFALAEDSSKRLTDVRDIKEDARKISSKHSHNSSRNRENSISREYAPKNSQDVRNIRDKTRTFSSENLAHSSKDSAKSTLKEDSNKNLIYTSDVTSPAPRPSPALLHNLEGSSEQSPLQIWYPNRNQLKPSGP